MRKKLVVGILAHVDAGKTTLCEGLLYTCGCLKRAGRVDHRDSFLDTDPIERERGITVFSKQARFSYGDMDVVLLDTPGHADLSAETERTLQVLDYAILLVSGTDGVRAHTITLWQLLRKAQIPTFLFVNKTDLPFAGEAALEQELREKLGAGCFAFLEKETQAQRDERLAMQSELFLEEYLAQGSISREAIAEAVADCALYPCLFGAALHMRGIVELLEALRAYSLTPAYDTAFSARVYKIMRETSGPFAGQRVSCMKITGGRLCVRDEICYRGADGRILTEKAAQILLFSGNKSRQVEQVEAGEICGVIGLSGTYAGGSLGSDLPASPVVLEPVLSYRICLPEGLDARSFYARLKQLEEEEPTLRLHWREESGEIYARLMGEVQCEVLCRLIAERFGISVSLDEGSILYRETVSEAVEGVGHFEPLRHYAEVHLLIEPAPSGSGILLDAQCPDAMLDAGRQRQVLEILASKVHKGVLTGSPLTDVKITLLAGRAHLKHTEGGDFREATLRAVRQGLMQAKSVLLEPFYRFRLELPTADAGRALHDLQLRSAETEISLCGEGRTCIAGRAPVSELRGYAQQVRADTHGAGEWSCRFDGYSPCAKQEELVAAIGYLPDQDLENPSGSVFCKKGAGYGVPWNEVRAHMHVDSGYQKQSGKRELLPSVRSLAGAYQVSEKELAAILQRTFGQQVQRKRYREPRQVKVNGKSVAPKPPKKPLLIIDGYNVIFAWESLKESAKVSLEGARGDLMIMLANYVGYTGSEVILVFDGYRVPENRGEDFQKDGFRVIYTAHGETADARMERLMHELGPGYHIRAVTSDALIQVSALHSGVLRMTSAELEAEVLRIRAEITEVIGRLHG